MLIWKGKISLNSRNLQWRSADRVLGCRLRDEWPAISVWREKKDARNISSIQDKQNELFLMIFHRSEPKNGSFNRIFLSVQVSLLLHLTMRCTIIITISSSSSRSPSSNWVCTLCGSVASSCSYVYLPARAGVIMVSHSRDVLSVGENPSCLNVPYIIII